jgi:uncharacterized membrane protein
MAMMICMPWIVPLVWAIGVAHARRAKARDEITALALLAPVLVVGFGIVMDPMMEHSDSLSLIIIPVLIIAYLAASWGAVIWAHRAVSGRPAPRGFPIEPIKPGEKIEE